MEEEKEELAKWRKETSAVSSASKKAVGCGRTGRYDGFEVFLTRRPYVVDAVSRSLHGLPAPNLIVCRASAFDQNAEQALLVIDGPPT